MQTYGKAAPRIGTVAPGTKRGIIEKAMQTTKPKAPAAPKLMTLRTVKY